MIFTCIGEFVNLKALRQTVSKPPVAMDCQLEGGTGGQCPNPQWQWTASWSGEQEDSVLTPVAMECQLEGEQMTTVTDLIYLLIWSVSHCIVLLLVRKDP